MIDAIAAAMGAFVESIDSWLKQLGILRCSPINDYAKGDSV